MDDTSEVMNLKQAWYDMHEIICQSQTDTDLKDTHVKEAYVHKPYHD